MNLFGVIKLGRLIINGPFLLQILAMPLKGSYNVNHMGLYSIGI